MVEDGEIIESCSQAIRDLEGKSDGRIPEYPLCKGLWFRRIILMLQEQVNGFSRW